jgi:hypothetical protein
MDCIGTRTHRCSACGIDGRWIAVPGRFVSLVHGAFNLKDSNIALAQKVAILEFQIGSLDEKVKATAR